MHYIYIYTLYIYIHYIYTLCIYIHYVWLRCPLTLYIVDILWITVLKKFTVLHENLISGVFACFVGVSARKKIKIKNQNKKTANITHRAFLFTWIVHKDLIRIPQNMDKVTFRLSFQFPPQADI